MIDDRLSEEVEAGAKMIPMFRTDIVETDGGWEVRNSRWRYPRYRFEFNLMPGITDDGVVEELVNLFIAAGGAAEPFLFTPWRDFQAVDQPLDQISTFVWQLNKDYTRGGTTRGVKITRPIDGTVVIRRNGVVLGGANYAVDHDTGLVTFIADQTGQTMTADFNHDILVRFMDDELAVLAITGDLHQPIDVTLIQVKE